MLSIESLSLIELLVKALCVLSAIIVQNVRVAVNSARVMGRSGAKRLFPQPKVTPYLVRYLTLLAYQAFAGTSVNLVV